MTRKRHIRMGKRSMTGRKMSDYDGCEGLSVGLSSAPSGGG